MIGRRAILAACFLLAPGVAAKAQRAAPEPAFVEDFTYPPGALEGLLDRWSISRKLDRQLWPDRVAVMADPDGGGFARIKVEEGDAASGLSLALRQARRLVCDDTGSQALQMEAEPNGVAPTERAEIEIRADHATGAGEVIPYGRPVWYRFALKLGQDWPRDVPVDGRVPCRTVIHQIKQNAFKDGKDCSASPFFKIEVRPLGDRARFFAQIAAGDACAQPPVVRRVPLCVRDEVARDAWTTVHVRLDLDGEEGRADLWLNGKHCGTYQGAMGDTVHGARRNGQPFVDQQPRFGIYRDWRAETQTIYFKRIVFWNAEPAGQADWGVDPPRN